MKIYFKEPALLNLPQHGIQIPLTDGRAQKVVQFLASAKVAIDDKFEEQIELTREDLERVHTKDYVSKLFANETSAREAVSATFELIKENGEYHRYDPQGATLPLEGLVSKFLVQTKGTMAAVKHSLQTGEPSYFLGGGYHHAMSFAGRGFCLINDIVIAARWVQAKFNCKNIWVIDVDAHKGDGTAELTQNDPSIRTLSIHMQAGWPLDSDRVDRKGKLNPWFIENDVEIGIQEGQEPEYLQLLEQGLTKLAKLDPNLPDLAIVVQGSDPYEKDGLPSSGLLQLSKEEMLQRDLMVYNFLKERNIPQAYVMSGGYGEQAHEIYCQFLREILP